MALILREMSTRYGRTPGGYIWAILEPLGVIIILSVGFSLLLRAPALGSSFLLFYASAYLVLSLFQNVATTVARAMMFSKPLLVYPRVSWMDAILARFLLNTLTNLMVAFLLINGILFVIDARLVIDIVPMAITLSLAALLGLGIGTFNCALFGLFPAWEQIWTICTRPLFLASGIFYLYEELHLVAQNILWWNPLIHLTGYMRTGFYVTYHPNYINLVYVAAFGVVLLTLGLLLMRRHHKTILNR